MQFVYKVAAASCCDVSHQQLPLPLHCVVLSSSILCQLIPEISKRF